MFSSIEMDTCFRDEPEGSRYEVFKRWLREVWHFIVVPPLILRSKRLHYEQAFKKGKNNATTSRTTTNSFHHHNDHPNEKEDEDDFEIDYTRATKGFFQRLFAEFIGTSIQVTIYGAALLLARLSLLNPQSAAVVSGLTKLALIYTLGEISGAHFNPVITLAFTLRRVFPWTWMLFYWLAQFTGSIVAGLLVRGLFSGQYASLGTSSVNILTSTILNGFKWEIFLTFCLIFVVLQTATEAAIIGAQAALSEGAVLIATSQIGASKSSSSLNPFRTLGPSIINNSPDDRHSLWIYIAGPLVGSLVAYVVVGLMRGFHRQQNELTSAHGARLNKEHAKTGGKN